MKDLFDAIRFGLPLYVMLYAAMWFLTAGSSEWFFWTFAAASSLTLLVGAFAGLRQSQASMEPFVLVAIAAIITVAFLVASEHWRAVIGPSGELVFITVMTGIPLGIGASRFLKGEFRPMLARDVILGVIGGIAGALLALAVAASPFATGWRTFVPVAEIAGPAPFGFRLHAGSDTYDDLLCDLRRSSSPQDVPEWCKGRSSGGFGDVLRSLLRAVLAVGAALWDVVWLSIGVFLTIAASRTVLRKTALFPN